MIAVTLDASTTARVRLNGSPILEVVSWLSLVARGDRHPVWGDPGSAARFALRDPRVAALGSLLVASESLGYIPDFLLPKPSWSPTPLSLTAQLDLVRATPPERANRETSAAWASGAGGRGDSDLDLPMMAAAALSAFWAAALADGWSHVTDALVDHVHTTSELVAADGVGAMVNAVHPGLSWTSGALVVDKRFSRALTMNDTELVVVPSLLSMPRLMVQLDDPTDAYISYPFTPAPHRTRSHAPERLLGRGRALVLLVLRQPATTRQVARQVALTEPTVSHHLHALADAGLIRGSRQGRAVVYTLTTGGHKLIETMGTTPRTDPDARLP